MTEFEMDVEKASHYCDLSGRTIVVTGGTGVLGSEMAAALIAHGADVAILARKPSGVEALRPKFEKGPGRVAFYRADVLHKETLLEARDAIQATFGAVYGLVNAAGGNHPKATTGPDKSFFELSEEWLRYVVDSNLLGTIFPCQVFGRMMVQRGEGAIVNITSMAAMRPLTRTIAYSSSKAAVSNFTQWLAVHMSREYAPRIRVNAIAPGFFHTSQNHYLLYDENAGGLTGRGKAILEHTPMGRFGTPADLLGALLWLLSPASEFVTGAVIPVDGGFSAYSGV